MPHPVSNLKLNCHVHLSGRLPSSSDRVTPSWISFSRSTLQRIVW